MAAADSQSVQISISNGASGGKRSAALGKRVLRRSGLFVVGLAIGAAVACCAFLFLDSRVSNKHDEPTSGTLLASQTDAHTMNRRPSSQRAESQVDLSSRSIASVGNQPDSQSSSSSSDGSSNGNSGGVRVYQSNVFQSIPGPCDNVPVKQFGKDLCASQSCMETACDIANTVNISVDPCENFYEFACQGWLAKNVRPLTSSKWSVFSRLEKATTDSVIAMLNEPDNPDEMPAYRQAKQFFKKCSDVDELDSVGLSPLWEILESYGGWPMLYEEGTWNASNFDWMKSMADLKKLFGTSAILDINSNQNTNSIKYNTIHVQQPSLFLARPYLLDHQTFANAVVAYRDFISNVAREFLVFRGNENINETLLKEKASEIIAFESVIANLTRDAVGLQYELRNHSATVTLKFLQQVFDNYTMENSTNLVHFPTLLNHLYANTGVNITDDELVSVSDVHYMGGIFEILAATPEELLANYLHFRMAAWIVSGTTKPMRSYVSEFYNKVYGIAESNAREYTCSASAQEKFPLAIGYEFMKRHGNSSVPDIEEATEMFVNIRDSFRELLYAADWMNDTVRNTSLERLDKIQSCLGYPTWINNFTKIQSDYDGLELNQTTYFEQLLSVRAWITDQKLRSLRKPFEPGCKWSQYPGHIGAYYDIKRKTINIPLGILQRPFFDRNRPVSLNYGSLGSIIGHEITHGFTVPGWTEESNGDFSPIGECLVTQYNQFDVKEIKEQEYHLNGKLTLDENFPDNGGLLEAYKAYKLAALKHPKKDKKLPGLDKFTPEQLYFLGFATNWCSSSTMESIREQILTDHHSPGKYRVIGTLRNSKEFAKAWSCPEGSYMNPAPTDQAEKCSVF